MYLLSTRTATRAGMAPRLPRAFTLLEMIIVVVLIGLLVALGSFAYQAIVDKVRGNVTASNAQQIGKTVVAMSATDNITPLAAIAVDVDTVTLGTQYIWNTDAAANGLTVTRGTTRNSIVAVEKNGYCVVLEFSAATTVGSKPLVGTPKKVAFSDAAAKGDTNGNGAIDAGEMICA